MVQTALRNSGSGNHARAVGFSMHLLIAFDISDDKQRRSVVKLLEMHGVRIQQSLFEARLTTRTFRELVRKLKKQISDGDKIHYLPLCQKDLGRRGADGAGQVYLPSDYHIVE